MVDVGIVSLNPATSYQFSMDNIINGDILMAAAIAQLSQSGWSSLSKDLKSSVSDIILGHLPQEFILQATISICSILARGKRPNFEFQHKTDQMVLINRNDLPETPQPKPQTIAAQLISSDTAKAAVKAAANMLNSPIADTPSPPSRAGSTGPPAIELNPRPHSNQAPVTTATLAVSTMLQPPVTTTLINTYPESQSQPAADMNAVFSALSARQNTVDMENTLKALLNGGGAALGQQNGEVSPPDPEVHRGGALNGGALDLTHVLAEALRNRPAMHNGLGSSSMVNDDENDSVPISKTFTPKREANNGLQYDYINSADLSNLPSLLTRALENHADLQEPYLSAANTSLPLDASSPISDRDGHGKTNGGGKMKRFQCRFCSHTSNRKNELEDHERKHQSKMCFQCHMCDYKAKQIVTMKGHYYKVHGAKFCSKSLIKLDMENGMQQIYRGEVPPNMGPGSLLSRDEVPNGMSAPTMPLIQNGSSPVATQGSPLSEAVNEASTPPAQSSSVNAQYSWNFGNSS